MLPTLPHTVITTDASDGSSDCSTLDPNDDPGYLAWLANNGGAIATDECDDDATLTWTNNSATQTWSGDPANNQITITFTVSDACGNTAETTATYSIIDDQRPTITCPPDVQETAALNDCYKILVTPTDPTMGDNCSVPTLSWEMTGATTGTGAGTVTGESFNVGITTVMYVATDAAGLKDTCYFDVTIIDLNPPIYTLDCPEDISVNADAGICGAVLNIPPPPVEDPCGEPVTLVHDSPYASDPTDASGTYPVGATVITWTATDASGNTATCEQTVTVTDTQKPTITCPGDVEDQITDGGCSLVSSEVGDPTFTDNCSVDSLIYILAGATTGSGTSQKFNYASGVAFNVGVTTVTYVAFDAAGLTDTCSHTVWIKNLNAPQFSATCPSDVSVSADAGICGANLTVPVPVINNPCGEAYMVSNDWPSATDSMNVDGYYPVGTTVINWTITDASGNVTTCEQTVTVTDTQKPTITCPGDVEDQITDGGCSLVSSEVGDPTFTDNCSVDSLIYILAGATTGSGTSQKFNYASGVAFNVGVTTVTYVAFDAAGLTDTCSHTVWIKNLNAPQFSATCPSDVSVSADAGICGANLTVPVPVINNPCGEAYMVSNDWPSATDSMNVDGYYPVGTTVINWTITDASGNVTTCEQTVTVTDTQKPTITCPGDVEDQITDGGCSLVSSEVGDPTFTDNCSVDSLIYILAGATTGSGTSQKFNYASGVAFNVGVTTVTYVAFDAAGLTDTCSHTVWIKNLNAPQFSATCPSDVSVSADAGICGANLTVPVPVINNPCGEAYMVSNDWPSATDSMNVDGYYPVGTTVINWTITDASGNVTTCEQTVTVTDTQKPTITCPGDVEDQITDGGCSLVSSEVGDPTFTDNCSVDSLIYILAGATTGSGTSQKFNYASGVAFNVGVTTVTYVAFDAAGLTDTCSHTVWIKNLADPPFNVVCPPDVVQDADLGECYGTVSPGVPVINNPCGEAYMVSNDWPSAIDSMNVNGVYPIGTTIINWTIVDASGNVYNCTQNITVNDLLPTLICPPDIVVSADFEKNYASGVVVPPPTFDDNCPDSTLTWVMTGATTGTGDTDPSGINIVPSPNTFNVGVTTIEYTFTDAHGHVVTCSFTVTVESKPVIECPPDTTVYVGTGGCTNTFDPGIPDLLQGAAPIDWTWEMTGATTGSGSTPGATPLPDFIGDTPFNLGTTTITWTAANISGADTCFHIVTVLDTIPPTFTTAPYENCVDPLHWATYNPANPNPVVNHVDPEFG